MTVTEAKAVHIVLGWLLGVQDATGELVADELACERAVWLAQRARRVTWAGLTGEQIRAHWPAGGGLPL